MGIKYIEFLKRTLYRTQYAISNNINETWSIYIMDAEPKK